ncbi:hypothetical protein [Nostoc sp. FACHB-145]|uniref:hypothetical protein n=1 Tax=Nostoc sp. FACHB-145 TaxID=2692836 RepID=UPI001685F6D6|nr:hypothetical protein [Nostoc sp. FACHB-145]MBD2467870.1 hypothetical protein [Nostoc sp. FACHB-145]
MEYICTDNEHQIYLDINSKLSKIEKILKIGAYIANLPDDTVLKSFCKTEDLQFLWWKMRCFYGQIASCFCLLYLKQNLEKCNINIEDIFKEALEKKWIKKNEIEVYKYETERILKEWNLIEVGFPYLIAEMPNFPFAEDTEIFFEIMKNQANEHIKRRTAKYYEDNISERAKIYEQLCEAAQNNSHNKIKFLNKSNIHRYKLKEEIINFLSFKLEADQDLKQKWYELRVAQKSFDSFAVENSKNRNSNGKLLKSEVWKHGERYLITKNGLQKYPLIEELKLHFSESSLQEVKSVLQAFMYAN